MAFSEGLASFTAGRYGEAIARWEGIVRALGEERAFKVLYNLGLAYEASGDASRAIERFDAFLRHLAAQPSELTRDMERRQDAAERARAMKASRGALAVPAPQGRACDVRIDHEAPRPAGFTAYVAPGEHEVEVFSGSPDARIERVRVEKGREVQVDTAPPPQATEPRVVVVRAPEGPPEMPTAVLIGGGALTIATLVLPLALGLHAADLRSSAEALGRGHTRYAGAVRDFEDARTSYLVSYALPAAIGVTTLAIAGVFAIRIQTYKPPSPAPGAARGAGSASGQNTRSLSVSAGPAGVSIGGTF
ncbi:MAG: hypothetical protein R3B70_09645 [Polyangiaceae bacterium]